MNNLVSRTETHEHTKQGVELQTFSVMSMMIPHNRVLSRRFPDYLSSQQQPAAALRFVIFVVYIKVTKRRMPSGNYLVLIFPAFRTARNLGRDLYSSTCASLAPCLGGLEERTAR